MAKKQKDIVELLQAARRQHGQAAVIEEPEVKRLREEDKLIVVKPLNYDGKDYEQGDEIVLQHLRWDHKLMEQGFFTTPELYERGRLSAKYADFRRNALKPAERKWNKARRNAEEARQAVAAAEAKLQAARERQEHADNAHERAERELRAVLGDFLD